MIPKIISQILKDYEELDESNCVDKIVEYVEYLLAEDEEFIETLISKQDSFVICWNQPWYQRFNSVTRPFKAEAPPNMEDYRKDKITKDESDLIIKNWEKFVEEHNVPNKPICFARWRQKDHSNKGPQSPPQYVRHYIVSYLAQGLQRNLLQVYKHFINKVSYPNKGPYTEEEKTLMDICFRNIPEHAAVYLSHIMQREARGLYKRFNIAEGNSIPLRFRVKWTLELASEFLSRLLKYSELPLKKLRNRNIDRQVWMNMENDMGIPYYNLRNFWYRSLHAQLFIKEDVKLRRLKKNVLKILRRSEYKVWPDIRWHEIVKQFPKGYNATFVFRQMSPVMQNVPKYLFRPLNEASKLALIYLRESKRTRRLRRLRFNESKKKLEEIPPTKK